MVRVKTDSVIVRHYPEQHYRTMFDQMTGFSARVEDLGFAEPFWSPHGPELLDVAITNWCDRECSICYRRSSRIGGHVALSEYEEIMRQACGMSVFQVALGGGNPNQHPEFCEILRLTREDYDIVPCYTTNGRGLTDEILRASQRYCGAVAVSAYSPYDETRQAVILLTQHGIRTNVHFVLDSASIDTAIEWLETPPSFLAQVNAIVFLSYKAVGRTRDRALLLKRSDDLPEFFEVATARRHKFGIGFDSCLVSGLVRYTDVPAVCFDRCDAGRFSMFVSEDMQMYPCSFMVEDSKGIPVEGGNMLQAWQTGEVFADIRHRLSRDRCGGCDHAHLCMGGCPIFEEINLCGHD